MLRGRMKSRSILVFIIAPQSRADRRNKPLLFAKRWKPRPIRARPPPPQPHPKGEKARPHDQLSRFSPRLRTAPTLHAPRRAHTLQHQAGDTAAAVCSNQAIFLA